MLRDDKYLSIIKLPENGVEFKTKICLSLKSFSIMLKNKKEEIGVNGYLM